MKYLLLFTLIFASDVVEIKGLNEKTFKDYGYVYVIKR